MKLSTVCVYLKKNSLLDQLHIRDGNQMVFYIWNKRMTDLVKVMETRNGVIEEVCLPRWEMPFIYKIINIEIINDLEGKEYTFLKDKRTKKDEKSE